MTPLILQRTPQSGSREMIIEFKFRHPAQFADVSPATFLSLFRFKLRCEVTGDVALHFLPLLHCRLMPVVCSRLRAVTVRAVFLGMDESLFSFTQLGPEPAGLGVSSIRPKFPQIVGHQFFLMRRTDTDLECTGAFRNFPSLQLPAASG